jgi:hypothetical protein
MVWLGNQKYKKKVFKNFTFIFSGSQIWLNLPMHHHHFGYNTKLTPHKKKKKKTHCLECNWLNIVNLVDDNFGLY